MPAISHCFRRDAVYYWRRWTPAPKRVLLQVGLAVKDPRTARALSSILTVRSEELFPLWSAGHMNKSQLLQYLHHCLAQGRRHRPRDGLAELAQGLASRVLATRGLSAELTEQDRVGLDRQWGQPGLADDVSRAMEEAKRRPPDLETFVTQSIEASQSVAREPAGEDAEQAAKARLLADASLAFQAARDLSVTGMGLDQYVVDIADGKGLPDGDDGREPLASWLERTIRYLSQYNPYAYEGKEDRFELETILDDEQPTLLADWIRRGGPDVGSMESDHEYLERHAEALKTILRNLPQKYGARTNGSKCPHLTIAAEQGGVAPPKPNAAPPEAESAKIAVVAHKLVSKQKQREKWDEKTARQAEWTYFLFAKLLEEEHGVTRFSELRQRHIEQFDDFLLAIHSSFGRGGRDRSRSIAEVRVIARSKSATGLDIVTRSRHMGFLSALFEAARASEDFDPKLNPSAFTGKKSIRPRDERTIPKSDAMAAFFRAPVFVGCRSYEALDEPGPLVFHWAAYFAPLFAHYQGMRREEYCGLAVEDIIVGNGEYPYIHVCFNQFRRLKNAQSVRNLSLHPELIRLGFLDYVARLKTLEIERVFPDLFSPYSKSPLGDRLYKELSPIQERLGISPHQFRHFFNNELKQKRVSQEFREDMMGHRGGSETTERYCDPVLIELQREDLSKIELRTAHIQPQPIQLLPWVEAKAIAPWARADRAKRR